MKRIKHFMLTLLSVACTATAMFGLTSCDKVKELVNKVTGKEHDHTYTEVVTAPTCTEKGYTTYTCECGESYVDNYVDAAHSIEKHDGKAATCTEAGYAAYETCTKCDYTTYTEIPAAGHKYEAVITKYPSVSEAGEKSLSCQSCGDKKTEEIAALTMSLPKVSEVIASMINGVSCQLALNEGSSLTIVDNYTAEVNGKKVYVSVDVAEALIESVDGVLAGHIKLEFETYTVELDGTEKADEVTGQLNQGALYLCVNGEAISIELTEFDGSKMTAESTLSELVYTAVAQAMGITYNDLMDIAYICTEISNVVPKLAQLASATVASAISPEYIESVETLFTLFGENVIVQTKDASGNSVYTLDLQALDLFLDEIDGKKIGAYVDEVFGKGAMNSFTAFVVSLPDKTVKEIATEAITLAEAYDIDVDETYNLINFIAYKLYGAQIEVKSMIENCYDLTLGEVILSEMEDAKITVDQMKLGLGQAMSSLSEMTFDQLYNLLADNGKTDVEEGDGQVMASKEETAEKEFSIISELRSLVDELDEAVTLQVVIHETEEAVALVSLNVNVGGVGISYLSREDGTYAITASYNKVVAVVELNADGVVLTVSNGQTVLATASLLKEEGAQTIYKADLVVAEKDYLDFEAVFALDNTLLNLDATIRANKTERMGIFDEETGETEWVEEVTFIELFDINYTYSYDGIEDRASLILAMPDANTVLSFAYLANAEETWLEADLVSGEGDAAVDYLDFEVTLNGEMPTEALLVIRGYETKYDSAFDPETGEKYEVEERVFVEKAYVAYSYVSEPSKDTFVLKIDEVTFTLVHEADGANTYYTLTAVEGNEVVMEAEFVHEQTVVENVTTDSYYFKLLSDDDSVNVEVTLVNGEVTDAEASLTVTTTQYLVAINPETGEEVERVEETTKEEIIVTYDGKDFSFVVKENDVEIGDGSLVITDNGLTYSFEIEGAVMTESITFLENGVSYDIYFAQGEDVMMDAQFTLTGEGIGNDGNLALAYDISKMCISGDGDYVEGKGAIVLDWVLPDFGAAQPDSAPENMPIA